MGSRFKEFIYEKRQGNDLVYILNKADLISPTEYKVMESFDDIFVKMIRTLIDGRSALYYLTDEYRPVLSIASKIGNAGIISVIRSIIESASKLKSNGFLTCKNADASTEHIYVMKNTYKTAFLYLPVRETLYEDEAEFEKDLRKTLVRLAKSANEKDEECITEIIRNLEDSTIPLGEVFKVKKIIENNKKAIWLEGLDDAQGTVIDITKDEFIIGKWADVADGVISFNKMVSRIHCKINIKDGKYSVTDLKSANGTFVNGIRLMANKPFPIKKGDTIRLADSRFRFTEE